MSESTWVVDSEGGAWLCVRSPSRTPPYTTLYRAAVSLSLMSVCPYIRVNSETPRFAYSSPVAHVDVTPCHVERAWVLQGQPTARPSQPARARRRLRQRDHTRQAAGIRLTLSTTEPPVCYRGDHTAKLKESASRTDSRGRFRIVLLYTKICCFLWHVDGCGFGWIHARTSSDEGRALRRTERGAARVASPQAAGLAWHCSATTLQLATPPTQVFGPCAERRPRACTIIVVQ